MNGGYPAAQLGCQLSGCELARLAVAGRPFGTHRLAALVQTAEAEDAQPTQALTRLSLMACRPVLAARPAMHPLFEIQRAELLALARKRGVTGDRVAGSMGRGDGSDTSDVDQLVTLAPGTSALASGGLLLDAQDWQGRRVEPGSGPPARAGQSPAGRWHPPWPPGDGAPLPRRLRRGWAGSSAAPSRAAPAQA